METQIFGLIFVTVLCAYSCWSLPANSRSEDIKQLVSLLGKLKNIERARRQQQQYNHLYQHENQQLLSGVSLSSPHQRGSSSSFSGFASPADSAGPASDFPEAFSSSDVTNSLLLGGDGDLDLDLGDGSAVIRESYNGKTHSRAKADDGKSNKNIENIKRQGAWSYDYGLGGGRFGKRTYGDYGIGGGRFGRDVDHVDISDTSDADAATL
ncbi:Betsin [Plakobranchus ocellatus]|uniref:Betsin n=1 Tax=Plakobranchus ocellatus TaxID=259542 RepID=A0AAV4AXN4_9GAST|nr:Betsin [Plakobranchus ocellatus]